MTFVLLFLFFIILIFFQVSFSVTGSSSVHLLGDEFINGDFKFVLPLSICF